MFRRQIDCLTLSLHAVVQKVFLLEMDLLEIAVFSVLSY